MGIILKSAISGFVGTSLLLILYFTILTFISGWGFTKQQFFSFWYFIVSLALGFGVQVGLYFYLRDAIKARNNSKGVVITSGATTSVAMLSCCAHYLANFIPILGIAGIITVITQYQVQLFGVGIVANALGIIYMVRKIMMFKKMI